MNAVRGDVEIRIGGRVRRLRLTFGALAEIETLLGVSGFAALGARLPRLSAGELAILLRAGGEEVDAADLPVELATAASAVARAFEAALA